MKLTKAQNLAIHKYMEEHRELTAKAQQAAENVNLILIEFGIIKDNEDKGVIHRLSADEYEYVKDDQNA